MNSFLNKKTVSVSTRAHVLLFCDITFLEKKGMKIRELVNTHRKNAYDTEYDLIRQSIYRVALLR